MSSTKRARKAALRGVSAAAGFRKTAVDAYPAELTVAAAAAGFRDTAAAAGFRSTDEDSDRTAPACDSTG